MDTSLLFVTVEGHRICGATTTQGGHVFAVDDETGQIDVCAFDGGHHNGPRCLVCRDGWCHHCEPSVYTARCLARAT